MPILKIAQTVDGNPKAWDLEVGDHEMTLGRDKGCTVPLDDKAVSRSHARLVPTRQGILLRDLGSSNGTWVNGKKISEVLLNDGDEIRIGSCAMRFVLSTDQAKTAILGMEDLKSGQQAPPPAAAPPPKAAAPPPVQPPPAAPAPPPPPRSGSSAPAVPPFAKPFHTTEPSRSPSMPQGAVRSYAGFWIRLIAFLLDSLILGAVIAAVMIPGFIRLRSLRYLGNDFLATAWVMGGVAAVLALLYLLVFWAVKGKTPGKMALGLRIVREDGVMPLGWGRALLRLLGCIVNGATLAIGFLLIAFTYRKRGLHDMIAGTAVVKTR